jgi:hypothetical protein
MKMHRLLAPLIGLGLLFAAAPAAHAEANRSFDFKVPTWTNEGTAHTWGMASFKSGKRVVLTGRVNDECPADSYGAYLDVRVNLEGGSGMEYRAKDVGGCKDKDGVAYSFDVGASRKILSVRLWLKECDSSKSYCGGYGYEKVVSLDNPLT